MRELRGIKLCLYLAFAGLYFEKFMLQCYGAALRILREPDCYFAHLVGKRHRLASQDIAVGSVGHDRPAIEQSYDPCADFWGT